MVYRVDLERIAIWRDKKKRSQEFYLEMYFLWRDGERRFLGGRIFPGGMVSLERNLMETDFCLEEQNRWRDQRPWRDA